MQIQKNVSLADYSTMRLGGVASELCVISSEEELVEAIKYAKSNNLKVHINGSGSNTIFGPAGFKGLVIVNSINGIEWTKLEDGAQVIIGAGENWDATVAYCVAQEFSDIAALSLIPGTTGAAPVQNIGAYGQQVSDSVVSVRAYDTHNGEFVELSKKECGFSYRQSRFNTSDKDRFIITSIKMRLFRKFESKPFYKDVAAYFESSGVDQNRVSPAQLREAVSAVRVKKLPDPATVANCGSFFKNPIITQQKFDSLRSDFPELKAHETDDGNLKLYGAQLIELCGLKDYHDPKTGMATWKNQALVLVNEHANTATDLQVFKQMIVNAVKERFGITLVQEPEFIELV